jgi:hypothetical protein
MELVLIILVLAVLVVGALVAKKPDEFRVARSAMINATPEKIFPHINNLHKWGLWSPWAKMDPEAKMTFNGPEEGVEASCSWVGKKTGEGTMTITESRPTSFVQYRLQFVKPMKATNMAEFTLTPHGNATEIHWSMYGPNNLMGKIMSLFMNCDKMVGDQFEQGLRDLKAISEAGPNRSAA